MRNFSLLIIFLQFLANTINAQDLYSTDNLIQFGDYLYHNQEYSSAIREYKHALFLDNSKTYYHLNLFNAYLKTGEYSKGIREYENLHPFLISGNDSLEMVYGKLLIHAGEYPKLDTLVQFSSSLSDDQKIFLSSSQKLMSGEWYKYKENKTTAPALIVPEYYQSIVTDIQTARYKSPYISLGLSAIVPGSGKMYSGYWRDGISSLMVIGLTAWQAYRGFTIYDNKNAYSWIFAGLSATFYISNLYGSFKAAGMKNHTIRHSINDDIESIFSEKYNY